MTPVDSPYLFALLFVGYIFVGTSVGFLTMAADSWVSRKEVSYHPDQLTLISMAWPLVLTFLIIVIPIMAFRRPPPEVEKKDDADTFSFTPMPGTTVRFDSEGKFRIDGQN